MIEIYGRIKSIIFHNEENGYTVAKFESDDEEITVVGSFFAAENGFYKLTGDFTYHDKFGEQFHFVEIEKDVPKDEFGIIAYLSSGTFPYIGKKTAEKIVEKFGVNTLELLEENPYILNGIKGLGKKRVSKIASVIIDNRSKRKTLYALTSLGLSMELSNQIYKEFLEKSYDIVKSNPYSLIGVIKGVGFSKADEIALRLGEEKDSRRRIKEAIKYILSSSASRSQDTFIFENELKESLLSLTSASEDKLSDTLLDMQLNGEVISEEIDGKRVYFDRHLYKAEDISASKLLQIYYDKKAVLNIDYDEKELEFLDSIQKEAVLEVFKNKITVITGGPGTGKTTILKHISQIAVKNNLIVELCAPTGKASKRLSEATGLKAQTIHRLLKYGVDEDGNLSFQMNRENPLIADLVIVDEASMLDIILFQKLLESFNYDIDENGRPIIRTRLILVGDISQLPSVGPGNVLKDIIKTKIAKVIRLKNIYRQKKNSNIAINAHKINEGLYPSLNEKGKDFFFIDTYSEDETLTVILDLVQNRLRNFYKIDPIRDIQILTFSKRECLVLKL